MCKYIIKVLLILIITTTGLGQDLDSLIQKLKIENDDQSKLNTMIELLSVYFSKKDINAAEKVIKQTEKIIPDLESLEDQINFFNKIGVLLRNNSLYEESLKFHQNAYLLSEGMGNKKQQAVSLNNIGVVYRRYDEHAKAAEYHTRALKIAEDIKDTFAISVAYNSLGNIFSLNGRYNEAIDFFNKALKLSQLQKNKLGQAINYNNIGEVFEFSGDYKNAEIYYLKSLKINEEISSNKGIAISYNAVGKVILQKGDPVRAGEYFSKALEIDQKLGDKKFIAESYLNLGRALFKQGRTTEAIQNIDKSIVVSKEIHSLIHLQGAFETLSNIYSGKNNFERALEYFKIAEKYKDSVLNEKTARHISTIQAVFETEKKDQLAEKEIRKQRIINVSLIIGLVLSFTLIILIYIAFATKRKANIQLSIQNKEIEAKNLALNKQKDEIQFQKEELDRQRLANEVKNKNLEEAYQIIENYIGKITDSIRYAEKIQNSIFPIKEGLNCIFNDHFIFIRPKDIVSGDFYWYTFKNELVYFAIADCTGHGVPGAFMSIVGIDLLNQAINQNGLEQTPDILAFLNTELRRKLKRDKNEAVLKDSMDIGLCCYNRTTGEINFSGALIPMFLLRNGEVEILKADNTTLGISTNLFSKSFSKQTTYVKPGDSIFLTTDGILDQFGGERNKKFMRSQFFSLINKIKDQPSDFQKEEIERSFLSWKGKNEQIDDVLVWGIKL